MIKEGIYFAVDMRDVKPEREATRIVHALVTEDKRFCMTYEWGSYGDTIYGVDFDEEGGVFDEENGHYVIPSPEGLLELWWPDEERLEDVSRFYGEDFPAWTSAAEVQEKLSLRIGFGMM